MQPISRSICGSCRFRLQIQEHGRSFVTSIKRNNIPPEAPNYIDVPLSHQPDLTLPYRPKGILPVPREIFPRQRPDKPSPEYIKNVTMDPLPKNVRSFEGMTELQAYKARMTEVRKKNLREGLKQLHKRKQSMDRNLIQRSDKKHVERAALVAQAEREDARLTNVSIPSAMLTRGTLQPSKEYAEAELQQRKLNVEKHAAKKAEARKDALHTLYMNARTFITTEEQLLAAIDKEFDQKQFNQKDPAKIDRGRVMNIWDEGQPQTVAEMLRNTQPSPRNSGVTDIGVKVTKDQQRMKRIAEELSGGRM